MEKLLESKPAIKGKHAFIRQEQKTEENELNQPLDSRLMELLAQIKTGNQNAMETLSVRYIQLVISVAGDFKGNGLTDLELILKGTCGLIKAAENFEISRGIDFSAYAMWAVRQQIIKAIDEYEFNKPMPLNQIGLLSKKRYWNQNYKKRIDQLF